MAILLLALYAEGSVDRRFLPVIIQRTSEAILAMYGKAIIDIPDTIIIPKKHEKLDECILQAAKEARHHHALFVHNDSDNLTYDSALQQRFVPGFNRVQQATEEVCRKLVPIIPIRMIEAWMLADYHALCQVLGTNLSLQALGLPNKASLVESIAKPKETINGIIRKINAGSSRNRRTITLDTRYELLARQISLNKLLELSSYKQFVKVLMEVLEELHFIYYGSVSKITNNFQFTI